MPLIHSPVGSTIDLSVIGIHSPSVASASTPATAPGYAERLADTLTAFPNVREIFPEAQHTNVVAECATRCAATIDRFIGERLGNRPLDGNIRTAIGTAARSAAAGFSGLGDRALIKAYDTLCHQVLEPLQMNALTLPTTASSQVPRLACGFAKDAQLPPALSQSTVKMSDAEQLMLLLARDCADTIMDHGTNPEPSDPVQLRQAEALGALAARAELVMLSAGAATHGVSPLFCAEHLAQREASSDYPLNNGWTHMTLRGLAAMQRQSLLGHQPAPLLVAERNGEGPKGWKPSGAVAIAQLDRLGDLMPDRVISGNGSNSFSVSSMWKEMLFLPLKCFGADVLEAVKSKDAWSEAERSFVRTLLNDFNQRPREAVSTQPDSRGLEWLRSAEADVDARWRGMTAEELEQVPAGRNRAQLESFAKKYVRCLDENTAHLKQAFDPGLITPAEFVKPSVPSSARAARLSVMSLTGLKETAV